MAELRSLIFHKHHNKWVYFFQMNDLLHHLEVSNMTVLEKLVHILKPFQETTTLMSSESSCTLSLIRPLMCHLLRVTASGPELDGDESDEPPIIHQMKAVMRHNLETRLVRLNPVVWLSHDTQMRAIIKHKRWIIIWKPVQHFGYQYWVYWVGGCCKVTIQIS